MRILLIADRSFTKRESALLRRIELGLLDESFRVAIALPATLTRPGEEQHAPEIRKPLRYADNAGPLTRRLRSADFALALNEAQPLGEPDPDAATPGPIDVVHAFGRHCWAFASSIARRTHADLLLECWSSIALRNAPIFERSPGADLGERRAAWVAPSAPMARALERHARLPVALCPWGVHVPDTPRSVPATPRLIEKCSENELIATDHLPPDANEPPPGTQDDTPMPDASASEPAESAPIDAEPPPAETHARQYAVTIIATPDAASKLTPIFDALASLITGGLPVQIFLSESAVITHPRVWKEAKRADLLGHLSIMPDMETRRDLILEADACIVPGPTGLHRTLVLDALAAGLPVIAARDPMVSWRSEPSIAELIDSNSERSWAHAIERVLTNTDHAAALANAARAFVREHHLASAHIATLIRAYRTLAEPGPLRFSTRNAPTTAHA